MSRIGTLTVLVLCFAILGAPAAFAADPGGMRPVSDKALNRLSGGLKIPTVGALPYEETNFAPFEAFTRYLEETYPEVFTAMRVERINKHSLIFHWKGKNPALKPILFLSHYDVVPARESAPEAGGEVFNPGDSPYGPVGEAQTAWKYPPFSGAVADGRVYGRGALDMKGMLFAIMEAAEMLLAEGFQPEQDIWFAFGHDEETGGVQGAVPISKHFASKGLVFDAVFDEGGVISLEGAVLDWITRPIALVGLGEKGFLSLKITVRGMGGHSSIPVLKSPLVLASEIVLALNANQLPARITPPIASLLQSAKGMDLPPAIGERIRAAETDREGLLRVLGGMPVSNALIRTTTAITMMHGSDAANVIAPVAEVVVNFRILDGDTIASVTEHVRALCKDYDVAISVVGSAREASGLTPPDSKGLRAIRKSLKSVYPDALVAPYITVGGTDAYKYQTVSENIYRFMPVRLNMHEIGVIHNANEYISVENYGNMIHYFRSMMRSYQEVAE